jgi:hypothetical protein
VLCDSGWGYYGQTGRGYFCRLCCWYLNCVNRIKRPFRMEMEGRMNVFW